MTSRTELATAWPPMGPSLVYTPQCLTGLNDLAPSYLVDVEVDDSELEPSLGWMSQSLHFIESWAGPSVEIASSEAFVDTEHNDFDLEHSDNGDLSFGEMHRLGLAPVHFNTDWADWADCTPVSEIQS